MTSWHTDGGVLAESVEEQVAACLAVYREDPSRIEQDANNEARISEGGYQTRQLIELVQNAIDAADVESGRIEVRLTETHLLVANNGAPFTADGVRAVMASDLSRKDADQIGRFGIGFKSVLAISDRPAVLSRSVAFEFDAVWAREQLMAAGYDFESYPTTRLARVLDMSEMVEQVKGLSELIEWASTVVVLPIARRAEELYREITSFDREVLLFSSHVEQIVLRAEREGHPAVTREVTRESQTDGVVRILENGDATDWRLSTVVHQPSERAIREAGRIAGREKIELTWAVPSSGSRVGSFWAYFPTESRTTLSGIINAPWKLSDDRTQLLESAFNEELLTEALPRAVRGLLSDLHDPENPGRVLDILPARGQEERSWADRVLNDPVFDSVSATASLPTADGGLSAPQQVRLLPGALDGAWVNHWMGLSSVDLSRWVSPAALSSPERISKARRLIQKSEYANPTVSEWLESVVEAPSETASISALELAALVFRNLGNNPAILELKRAIRDSKILMLEDGSLARPQAGAVYVRQSPDESGRDFVSGSIAADPVAVQHLSVLGIAIRDEKGKLRERLLKALSSGMAWGEFWVSARQVDFDFVVSLVHEHASQPYSDSIQARTASGEWAPIGTLLLAGRIIPADAQRDLKWLIDPDFHRADEPLLIEFGAVDGPRSLLSPPTEPWFSGYREAAVGAFVSKARGAKPNEALVELTGAAPAWPLSPFRGLSPEGRVRFTEALIRLVGVPAKWTVRHASNASYGSISVDSPEAWLLGRYGMLSTSFGPLQGKYVVASSDESLDPNALPVRDDLSHAEQELLGTIDDLDGIPESVWEALKSEADRWQDDSRRYAFYSYLPGRLVPSTIVVAVGPVSREVERDHVGVTSVEATYTAMKDARVPALLAQDGDDVERFVEHWGLSLGEEMLRIETIAEGAGESSYLIDEYPPLRLNPELSGGTHKLQRCDRIVRLLATDRGQVESFVDAALDGETILVTAHTAPDTLRQVSEVLGLAWTAEDINSTLKKMRERAVSEHKKRVRRMAEEDEFAGFVLAVGEEAVRGRLPRQALEIVGGQEGTISSHELGRLAFSVHGVSILKAFRAELESAELDPPHRLDGGFRAREWVRSLSFPLEWSGFPAPAHPAQVAIEGPAELLGLHNYQIKVKERVLELIRGDTLERGVVSLPTGAGKTRVAVEAIIEDLKQQGKPRLVLWIAQQQELCEQAVETWGYVWRAIGPDAQLHVSRLWGSNTVDEVPGAFHLVVATDAKLAELSKQDNTDYQWLRSPWVVVVDEAHTSVSAQFTQVLEWVDRSGRTRHGNKLLGLTATPFRGHSSHETGRLVRRYDSNLLDQEVFTRDPYEELQELRVLARVRQQLIDGIDVDFTEDEINQLKPFGDGAPMGMIPRGAERRIGESTDRTARIVESICALPEDWPVLLFAPSVENARTLAGLLAHRGISAVAVDGETEPAARKHYVEEFRAKRIRVLTNYGVLVQGFDAPAVRAVYVARPTFSPNVYQQMIGRGLRGPLNGGSSEVLIVNVRDNFNQFGDKLAFREFASLWNKSERPSAG